MELITPLTENRLLNSPIFLLVGFNREKIMQDLNCAGIYKITCSGNNKFYIGSTKCFDKRFRQHLKDLRHNRHHSKYLQNSFSKYGEESLIFEVVELVTDQDKLLTVEFSLIESLKPEFNSIKTVGNPSSVEYSKNLSIIRRDIIKSRNNSATGIAGVMYSTTKNKYAAYITLKDVKIPLGSYLTLEEAVNARKEGERVYWSEEYEKLTEEQRSIIHTHNVLNRKRSTNKTSEYKHICFEKKRKCFTVTLPAKIKHHCKTLEEALIIRNSHFPELPEELKCFLLNV